MKRADKIVHAYGGRHPGKEDVARSLDACPTGVCKGCFYEHSGAGCVIRMMEDAAYLLRGGGEGVGRP